jgi:monofunctional biosynthetic peptidoglycan transglycosylase
MNWMFLPLLLANAAVIAPGNTEEQILVDFADAEAHRGFRPINDGVMGGVSTGAMVHREGEGALFHGVVSLERNGGFASVRSLPGTYDLSGFDGIALHVRGDGKTYKLQLKTSAAFDGVQYQARFQAPPDVWRRLLIPFSAFVPTFRGRVLGDGAPLDPGRIASIGFMISDRQEGPFSLSIARIGAYRGTISAP